MLGVVVFLLSLHIHFFILVYLLCDHYFLFALWCLLLVRSGLL